MEKTSYSACATKHEEFIECSALNTENYPAEYAERVSRILADIKNSDFKERVKQTLGSFVEAGSDGKLAQSSPYRLVVLQEAIPKGKVLVARPRLQTAKENDPNFMSGFYVDFGLNLVASKGKNYKINQIPAREIARDLERAGIKLDCAKLIPYNVLACQVNSKSPSGLVFKLSDKGKDIAEKLVLNTDDFEWDYKPSNDGLFRAFIDSYDYWFPNDEDLADSTGLGRVVVESAKGTAKSFR